MRRRTFLGAAAAVPVVAVVGNGYATPLGDEPIEVLYPKGRWVEFPFEHLVPGDIIRRKRDSKQEYEVTDYPNWRGEVLVKSL